VKECVKRLKTFVGCPCLRAPRRHRFVKNSFVLCLTKQRKQETDVELGDIWLSLETQNSVNKVLMKQQREHVLTSNIPPCCKCFTFL